MATEDAKELKGLLQEIIKTYDMLTTGEVSGQRGVVDTARELLRMQVARASAVATS